MPRKPKVAKQLDLIPDEDWATRRPLGEGVTFINQNVPAPTSTASTRSGHGEAPVWNGSLYCTEDRRYHVEDLVRFVGASGLGEMFQWMLDGLLDSKLEEIRALAKRGRGDV